MNLRRYTFSSAEFSKLPLTERLLFIRLAQVSNDLRHIQLLTVREVRAVNEYAGVEQEIALHQMIFGLRQWYAVLNEAWKVVNSGWRGDQLGKKFYSRLTKGKDAFDYLSKYFSNDNLVRTIRDHFASHYEIGHLPRLLDEFPSSNELHFVSAEHGGNMFYAVAENFRNFALISTADEVRKGENKSSDEERIRDAVRKLYDEAGSISNKFDSFVSDLLPLILTPCSLRAISFTSAAVADPEARHSIIFVDEDAVVARHRNRRK